MKIKLVILISALITLLSCSKSSNNSPNYLGTYSGNLTTYMNGTVFSTMTNHSITFNSTSTANKLTMINNIMQSTTATISGNLLNIPTNIVNTTQTFKTVEYGTGTFSGNTIIIDFHQEIQNPTTNAILSSGEWKGTLTKQ